MNKTNGNFEKIYKKFKESYVFFVKVENITVIIYNTVCKTLLSMLVLFFIITRKIIYI